MCRCCGILVPIICKKLECLCSQIFFDRTVVPFSRFLISDRSLTVRKTMDKVLDIVAKFQENMEFS